MVLSKSIGVKLHSKAATIPAGSLALHGWQIVSGDIDVQAYWQTVSGKLSLDLNGTTPGTITQSFATVVGKSYQLTFFYANNPDSPGLTANANVTIAGQTTAITHSGSTATAMNYTQVSSTFVATATSTSLMFTSTTSGGVRDRPRRRLGESFRLSRSKQPHAWDLDQAWGHSTFRTQRVRGQCRAIRSWPAMPCRSSCSPGRGQ